jgi:glycoside/pentoside/hexuronide:cation symporter, GPH family
MSKLSLKEKLGYSFGELSASSLWQGIIFFLPMFYTDIFGLTPGQVATLFLVVKVFDALNDPIMGIIADRTNTKWGKYRPYLLWFSIPIGIAFVLMFTTPAIEGNLKLLYAYGTHFLVLIFYTILMVPYNTLIGVVSSNQQERTSLSSYKLIFAYGATMLVQVLVINLVDKLGNGNEAVGYKYTMMIVAIISAIALLLVFATTKERVKPISTEKNNIGQDIKDLTKNKPWLILVAVSLLSLIYIVIRSGAIMYYFEYYIGSKKLAAAFMVSGTLAVAVGVLPTAWLSRKIGKIRLYIISMIIVTISCALFIFVKPENIVMLFTIQIIFSLASGPSFPLLFSMMADTADYSEWKTGRRATGLIYSTATFAQKSGVAFGGAIAMWILAAFSYEANVMQSAESLMGIKLLLSLIPAILAAAATVFLFSYKLDEKKLTEIEKDLQSRREEAAKK